MKSDGKKQKLEDKLFYMSKTSYYRYQNKDRNDVQEVRTLQIGAIALQKCNQRNYEFARSCLSQDIPSKVPF